MNRKVMLPAATLAMLTAVTAALSPYATKLRPMFTIETQIEIDAPPHTVWSILTDGSKLSEWSPFVHRLEGELTVGNRLSVEVGAPGKKRMTFTPTVLRADPGRELRWVGKLLVSGVFDGEHVFELVPSGAGTTFKHYENFSGLLVPLFKNMLDRDTKPGFELMNQALKARAESHALAQR